MRVILFGIILGLTACGNSNVSRPQTADSVKKIPVASPGQQIPGTPGPAGTDSSRHTPTEVKANDSAR